MTSRWLATFRGRLGVAFDRVLFYGTGGLPVGKVSYSDFILYVSPGGATNAAAASQTRTGWTADGGVEWALTSNWSVKAEYLYVDLGTTSYVSNNSIPAVFSTVNWTYSHHFTKNIARVGLNYRFGGM
jgi:outer membrane immunogenic protein